MEIVRKGHADDLPRIIDGNLAMALETEELLLNRERIRPGVQKVLEGKVPATYWVVESEGQLSAQLMITEEWSDWRNAMVWWIQSVYVWPEFRRTGCFQRIYHHVLAEAQKTGIAGLRLYVDERNKTAQEVYRRIGMDGEHYRVFEKMFD